METRKIHQKQIFRILGGFVILYIAIFGANLILGIGPNLLMKWLGVSPNLRAYLGDTYVYGLRLVAYILLPGLALWKMLGINPWPSFFPAINKHWKDMLYGYLLVSFVLGLFFLVEIRLGWLTLEGWKCQTIPLEAWLRLIWKGFLVNLCVAVGEETIFRGYLLTSLKTVWGRWWSLLAMMVSFGLFHIIAYSESGLHSQTLAFAILFAALVGGLFGLIYLRTHSLWLPIVLHFSWNFVENDLLNLAGELDNANLIGALTTTELGLGNIVFLDMLAFGLVAIGLWFWLRRKNNRHHRKLTRDADSQKNAEFFF